MLHGLAVSIGWFVVSALVVYVILLIGDRIHPAYRAWEEVEKGNVAVGLVMVGQLIGMGIITMGTIQNSESLLSSVIWSFIGGILLLLGYLVFEWATPRINVGKGLAQGNKAIGVVSMGISIGLALVVAACINS